MKQSKVLLIATIIVVILVISLFAFYWNTSLIHRNTVEAKITDFTVDWGYLGTIVGVTTVIRFNVTIKNTGTEDIGGMNAKLALISNGTSTQIEDNRLLNYYGWNFTLTKGETTSKIIDFLVNLDTHQQMHESNQNFQVLLSSNSTVLDERKLF